MLSAVGESAQVALQASTIGPSLQTSARVDSKSAEKQLEAATGGGRTKGDTVTVSTEARQLMRSALKAAEESQESPNGKANHESAGRK